MRKRYDRGSFLREVHPDEQISHEALLESEARFRAVTEAASDAIVASNNSGHIVFWNRAAEEMFGYSEEEALGKPLEILMPERYRSHHRAGIARLSATGQSRVLGRAISVHGLHRDGHEFPIELSLGMWNTSSGPFFTGIIRDTSLNQRAEEVLRVREDTISAIIEAQQKVASLDLDRQGLIRFVAMRAAGLTKADFAAVGILEGDQIVYTRVGGTQDGEELVRLPVADSVAEIVFRNWEPIRCSDCLLDPRINRTAAVAAGVRALVVVPFSDHSARTSGVLAVTSHRVGVFDDADVKTVQMLAGLMGSALKQWGQNAEKEEATSERTEALERLEASERRFRSLIENSSDPIVILDENAIVKYASPANKRTLGYETEEREGHNLLDFLHPDDTGLAKDALSRVFSRHGATATAQVRYRHKNGTYLKLSVFAKNLLDDPAVRGVVLNARDITDESSLSEQLRQSQKMEAVGMLAGGIAHDFNNLLTVIQGRSDFLLNDIPPDDARHHDVEEIRKASARAASLTQQLLAFSRKQLLQPDLLDLNEVVTSVESMFTRLIGETIKVTTVKAPRLGRVMVDRTQIEQVLMNLVVNARDAMPEGGSLRIETADVELDETFRGDDADFKSGSYVMVSVRDTGIGMDAETRAHIFDPFFTTKEIGKGTGLGLSTVYGIVKQSGGCIRVYSEPNLGTVIKVFLPKASVDGNVRPGVSPKAADNRGTETILLVEDDEGVRKIGHAILQRYGYHVLDATNGHHALISIESHPGEIDLVATDVVMPVKGGRELASELRARYPKIKILYLSGYTRDDAIAGDLVAGAAHFLEKPFTAASLAAAVRCALDEEAPEAPAA